MALKDVLQTLEDVPSLRMALNTFERPSEQLANYVNWVLPADRVTLETGLSVLSGYLARRSAAHSCILPSEAAAADLRSTLSAGGIALDKLRVLTGDCVTATHDLATDSIDSIILSCSPAFPAYFAACHESLRLLRAGGRLILRGVGIWTVEQLKNHLRIDPRFVGFSAIAPDAVVVQKAAATQDTEWFEQPYVVLNSAAFDSQAVARARRESLRVQMRIFSNLAKDTDTGKAERQLSTRLPDVGLAGYYGFGNYGDEMFRTCFELGLPDFRLRMMHDMPRRPFFLGDKAARVRRVDAVLIGGGDLVIPGYWNGLYFEEEYLEKPVFIHGVGVPRTGGDAKVIDRLRAFVQHANLRYFNVRDVESRDWIEKHLKPRCEVEVSPDIVFGFDLPAPRPTGAGSRLALVTRMTKGGTPEDFQPLRALTQEARRRGIHVSLVIAGAGQIADDDYADAVTRGLAVAEIVSCETMEDVTEAITACDIVVSMKFHGCVIGILAGRPTFGLLKSDKFVNLYRYLGLETMIMSYNDPKVATLLDIPARAIDADNLAALQRGAKAAMARLRTVMGEEFQRTMSC